jgi:crotonobetainyl-CoA:carnitine CoA-transferase CaiB-like acyl-CoA transferase
VVAIPATGAILADMGAEVIKLEPLTGEIQRGNKASSGVATGAINWSVQVLNRNKKGLALNLKSASGLKIFHELIKKSDVFMHNYELDAVKKLGLDYASLCQVNPRLIYAAMNGYGTKGPDRNERGYDYAAGWARSGIMDLIGEPGRTPSSQRPGMMDSVTGTHVATGILAALYHREKTGRGQEIETSLYHVGVWTLSIDIQMALGGLNPGKRTRYQSQNPLFNSYRTKDDRWIWMAMLAPDPTWPGFCQSLDHPEWERDPRFNSMDARGKNCQELIRLIDEVLATRTLAEWEPIWRRYNVIYGRVQSPAEVISDPQALANDFFAEVEHPDAGKVRIVNTPIKFLQEPGKVETTAPEVGQHTEDILLGLGFTWEDLGRFKNEGVIL